LLYIGVVVLGVSERDFWRMTPYKLLTLFRIHKIYCPQRKGFIQDSPAIVGDMDDIDVALGGL